MTVWSNPVFAGLVGGVVGSGVTLATAALGYLNKDRELDIEMVRVSLSILAGENKDTSLPGRRFALRALETYSGVEIPTAEYEEWARRGTVPEGIYNPYAVPGLPGFPGMGFSGVNPWGPNNPFQAPRQEGAETETGAPSTPPGE